MENSKHVRLGNMIYLANDNFTEDTTINPSTVDPRRSADFPVVNSSSSDMVPINNKPKR